MKCQIISWTPIRLRLYFQSKSHSEFRNTFQRLQSILLSTTSTNIWPTVVDTYCFLGPQTGLTSFVHGLPCNNTTGPQVSTTHGFKSNNGAQLSQTAKESFKSLFLNLRLQTQRLIKEIRGRGQECEFCINSPCDYL